ncbi:MAG: NAD(P)-dependent oxidoreductase [Rhizomicrobium sp.]|jgi:nucleoside-diphosphate-sugar epimerase
MTRVLVTGATGLIGRHISTSLAARGIEVHGVARHAAALDGTVMHACDVLDISSTRELVRNLRPDIVVHSAWVTSHGVYWRSPENLGWITASLALMIAAHASGTRRFIGVGTCAEYAASDVKPRNERTSAIQPATPYGQAKDEFRRTAELFASKHDMEFAWARVFMLYGAGEHPDRFVASLARALVAGEPARMSSGAAIRDFLDARDVGEAVAVLTASSVTGAVNVASGVGISLRDAGQKLAGIAGRPDLFAPGTLPDRAGEPASLVADVSRLKDEVGFLPKVSLDQGFRDALEYWRRLRGP